MSFIAVLSVNLGLINLFPIPILDGGHLVFYRDRGHPGAAACRRGRRRYGFRAGLALIACLFLFVTWNDLTSFGLFRWVSWPGGLSRPDLGRSIREDCWRPLRRVSMVPGLRTRCDDGLERQAVSLPTSARYPGGCRGRCPAFESC